MRVVSFFCPRPEHPLFQDYAPFLDLLRLSCERYGCEHRVLTDDPTIEDGYLVDVPRPLMPAYHAAMLQYMRDPANAEMPTLFTGADCVLGADPACFDRGADIVVTVDDRFTDCRINTGAVYVPRPGAVAHVWADALARCGEGWGDDQRAFRDALAAATGLSVAELPCDGYNQAPDHPDHNIQAAVIHFRGPRKAWMDYYCWRWLGLGASCEQKIVPNTPEEAMADNVRVNIARRLPEVRLTAAHDGHAVLVGGGPSVVGDIEEIRQRKEQGQTVFGLNGAARWLHENGITPDFGVILDPRPENERFLGGFGCRWLLASQCHPALVAACPNPTLWHFGLLGDAVSRVLPPGAQMVGGGITVGLTAMGLAYVMGYRQMHLYGYDSSEAEGEIHAYDQAETAAEGRRSIAWVAGRSFVTNPAMFDQAIKFEPWARTLIEEGVLITVHGDGLLPAIAHEMQRAAAALQEAA